MNEVVKEYLEDIDLGIFKQILQYNLNVSDEKVLIVGDTGKEGHYISPIIARAYARAADELDLDYQLVLQEIKWKGDEASDEVKDSIQQLPKESIIIMGVSGKIGKLHTKSFRKFCRRNNHRFISSTTLGVRPTEDVEHFLSAYDIDYEELSKKAHRLKDIFDEAEVIRVTTEKGTDLKYSVKGMEACVSDGIYRNPGEGGNLPGTETYVPCKKKRVNGKIVIDGSMKTRHGTSLVENPIEMTIKDGVVMAMNDNKESQLLEETLRWAHDKAKYPWGVRRIGEFGVGLNPNAKVIGCTVLDEKTLGTGHFAIGSNHWFGGSIYAIIHLDQVFHNPTIYVDGEEIDVDEV